MRTLPLLASFALAGCFHTAKPDFRSAEPAARNAAIVDAAANSRNESVPDLILQLRSDDPVTRMLAIRTLEQLTGQTHGYNYADTEVMREKAIRVWVEWWRTQATVTPLSSSSSRTFPPG